MADGRFGFLQLRRKALPNTINYERKIASMKKRVLSLLLALAMVLSLLPVTVFAVDGHDGQVRVRVENSTWNKADGAPWEGTLVDEWITLKIGRAHV